MKRLGNVTVIISLIASVMSIAWITYNWNKEVNGKNQVDT